MKKISELINLNVLGTLGTGKGTKKPTKPKSGALRLLLMLVAVVAMSGEVWGNSATLKSASGKTISGGGNHAQFSLTATNFNFNSDLEFTSKMGKTSETLKFTWAADQSEYYDIKVTTISLQIRGYVATGLSSYYKPITASLDGNTGVQVGTNGSGFTTVSKTKADGFTSGTTLVLTNGSKADNCWFAFQNITITYDAIPKTPQVISGQGSKSVTVTIDVNNPVQLDLSTMISPIDATHADVENIQFESSSFSDGQMSGAVAGGVINNIKYFYATTAGTYTYNKPYIKAKSNCHTESGHGSGSITITVNRLDPQLSVSTGTIVVTDVASNPQKVCLSDLATRNGTGAVTFSVTGGPSSQSGETYDKHCWITQGSDGKYYFHATVGGAYTLNAHSAITSQYNAADKAFTVNVTKLNTQVLSWPTKTTYGVGESFSVSGAEGSTVSLSATGAGAQYLSIAGNTATVLPVSVPGTYSVTVTATASATDIYAEKSESKNFSLTSKEIQTIQWDQSFSNLQTGGASITMTATAKTAITYTSTNTDVVTVTNGNVLNIVGKGRASVIAAAAETQQYAADTVTKSVVVRNPGESCAPYDEKSGKFHTEADFHMTWDYPSTYMEYHIRKPRNVGAAREAHLQQYYDGSWHDINVYKPTYEGQQLNATLNINCREVRVWSDAAEDMKVEYFKVYLTQYLNLSTSSLSMVTTTAAQTTKTFTVDFSNIQGPLEVTSNNSYLSFSLDKYGDCGEWGTATVTVTYNPQMAQDGNYTITVWDGKTEALKKTITVYCKATAANQTMTWSQDFSAGNKTTDLITFNAYTNADKTTGDYPVVYSSSDQSVATIVNGNKLNIKKSGTVTITASQDGKDANGLQRYIAVSIGKSITLSKVTPDIKTLPTVGAVKYGEKYSKYSLSGGAAETTYQGTEHTAVSGTFGWTTPDAQITTKDNLSVTFVPSNTGLYNNKVFTINAPSINNVVTFDPNQGTVTPTTKEVTYNSTYGELPTPTRYGYIFAGWFIGDNEITASSTVATMADHTLTAHWTAKKYNLDISYNGGNVGGSTTGIHVLPTAEKALTFGEGYYNGLAGWGIPSRDGYTFMGNYDANGIKVYNSDGTCNNDSKYWSGSLYNFDGDLSAEAHWDANTYKVTLNQQSGTGGTSEVSATYDAAMPSATAPTRTGYTFHGYYDAINGGGKQYYTSAMGSANKWDKANDAELYAYWTITPYTVNFDLNGGSSAQPSPITVYYGKTYGDLPTPTHASKKFLGWYLGDTETQITDTTTVTTTRDHTLKAHWDDACYVISFNANGGTGEMSNMIVGMTEEITVPANGFTAPSYTLTYDWNDGTGTTTDPAAVEFAGWEDHGSIVDYEGTTWTYTQFDGPFYANTYSDLYNALGYNKKSLINHYVQNTIHGSETRQCTGDPRGAYKVGGKNLSNLSTTNQIVPLYAQWRKDVILPSRVRTGYDFNGWYDGDTKVGNGGATYPFMSTKTLTAHWTAHRYCIWFVANGEGATRSKDSIWVSHGEKYGTLATATRYGYNFEGWYTQQEGGDLITSESIVNLSEVTNYLYAHWSPITYTISYNANGGTGSIASQNMTYNTDAQLTAFTGQITAPTIEHTLILDAGEGYIGSTHTSSVKANNAVFGGWEDHGSIVFSDTTYVNPVNPAVDPSGTNVLFFDAAAYGTNNSDVFALVNNKYDKYGLVNHYRNFGLCECQGTCGYNAKRCQDWQGEPGAYPDQAPVLNMTGEQGYTVPLYAHWVYTFDLPIPTRENYSFVGWYDRDKLVTKEDVVQTSRDQLTLTAHWVPNYTVHFDGNGATSAQLDDQIYNYDEQLNLPTSPTREHTVTYTGEGTWTEQTDKVTGTLLGWEDPTPATYTDEKYNVKFAAVAGVGIDSVFDAAWYGTQNPDVRNFDEFGDGIYDKGLLFKHYLYHGAQEGREPYPTDSIGYYPLKSVIDKVLTATYVRNLTNIPGQLVTLKAHWKIDSVTLPVATREGYQLAGWSDGTTTYVEKFLPKDKKQIELTSQWNANTYYVSFNGNGATSGSMDNQEFTYDDAAKALTLNTYGRAYTVSFNADGGDACADQTATYTFNNWNTKTDGSGTTYTNGQAVQNLTTENEGIFPLYAQWNTGSVTLPSTTKTGYSLTGWSDGTTTYNVGAQYTPSANITLTAVWGALAYTVTFDKQQGTGGSNSVSATFNAAMPSATKPSRTGYTFQGYFAETGGKGTKYYDADMTSAHVWDKAAATTLYAYWTANSYTVTFNGVLSGATVSPASKSVTYDAAYGTLATASHPSNRFDGWFTQTTGGTEVTAETICTVADNHNLYAHWTQLYYSRCKADATGINGCVGVYVTNQSVTTYDGIESGKLWCSPTDQTQKAVSFTTTTGHIYYYFAKPSTGYTHAGWSASKGGSIISGSEPGSEKRWTMNGTVTETTTTSDAPHWFTYYPVMTPNQYKVTFDKQSGTGGSDDVMATYDAAMPSATAPTRDGYTFAGYYDAVSGGTQYYTAAMASARTWDKAAATTLYARWTAKQYTVTLNPNYTGAATTNVTATYGSAMPSMGAVPTRTGHKFTGYYDAQDGGTQYYTESGASARTYDKTTGCTLYAHWTGADFFTWNNGQALTFGAVTTIPDTVAKAFSGQKVTYTSADPTIVKVESDGLHTLKAGKVNITAKTDGTDYYAAISETKEFTITKATPYIRWNQNFAGLEADPITGAFYLDTLLLAKAMNSYEEPTGQTITYSVAKTSGSITISLNGDRLIISGAGEGTVTATAAENDVYLSTTKTLKIYVRSAGDPCNTTISALTGSTETKSISNNNPYDVPLDNVPYGALKFSVEKQCINILVEICPTRDLVVSALDENGETKWTKTLSPDDMSSSEFTEYTYNIYETCKTPLKTLRFSSEATMSFIVKDIHITQASYMTTSTTKIENDNFPINKDFSQDFTVEYSDVPTVNAVLSPADCGLELIRKEKEDVGGCGAYGVYHYTVKSKQKWLEPTTVTASITLATGIPGDSVITIDINLQVKAGSSYYFMNTTGDQKWTTLGNWKEGSTTGPVPAQLPSEINSVVIYDTVRISTPVEVYALVINLYSSYWEKYGYVFIEPTGGITIYNGGVDPEQINERLKIEASLDHTGFFHLLPEKMINWPKMPIFTMQYATKGTLDSGADKDATWQYFGIPTNGSVMDVDYYTWLYEWSEPQGWIALPRAAQSTLKPFTGYAITQYGTAIYDYTGRMIMDSVTLNLTTGGAMGGDNMIANSFPAPIDTKLIKPEDFTGDVEKTIYLFNSGSWNQWKQQTDSGQTLAGDAPGSFTAIPILSGELLGPQAQTLIAPMQGICIHANTAGTVKLNYAKHVWYAEATGTKDDMNAGLHAPMRTNEADTMTQAEIDIARDRAIRDSIRLAREARVAELHHRVRINISGDNSGADYIYLLEKDGFTPAYDNGYDARKMLAENGTVTIYTYETDGQMAVSATNNVDSMYIGVIAGEDNAYKISFSSIIGDSLYLKDLVTNVETPINENQTYHFNQTATTKNDQRFLVVRHTKKDEPFIPTGDDQVADNSYIWTDAHYLHIENAGANSAVTLYTADGKLLYSETIHQRADISIDQLAQSIYLVYVDGKPLKFVKK